MKFEKPIPFKNEYNKPYWDAADQHELHLQKCDDCQAYSHPPGPSCVKCGSNNLVWENLGNVIEGKVYSYIVSYRPFLPGFQDDLPLIICQVQLKDVPEVLVIGNIIDSSPDQVEIDMPVKMIWQQIDEERALPQWKAI